MDVKEMNVLLMSAIYPDDFHSWGQWNKRANLAISKINKVKTEVVAPRPFSLPFRFFPHWEMCKIPLKESGEEGMIHHPRFLYPLPKKLFYGFAGNFYRYFVTRYMLQNIETPDLVHSHHIYPDGYGIIPLCKKQHIPLIVDIHGNYLFTVLINQKTLKNKIMETLDFSTKIICISKNIYSLAVNAGINEDKLEFVPLGVDIAKFKPRNKDKIRQEFGIQEQKIVLFVGQLIKRKGIKYLLNAISRTDKFHKKDSKFVIVGDGPEKNNLLDLSRKLGIEEVVTFTGKIPEDDLLKWYSLADLFVLPSLSEGRPTVINEAMSSECAIVASNVSGIPEQVKEGYNGFLAEPKNYKMLAEKIRYLLDNEEEMTQMCKNSRKRVLEQGWTWKGYASQLIKIFNEII